MLVDHASQLIGNVEGVKEILAAMREFPLDVGVQSSCCGALWSLIVNGRVTLALAQFTNSHSTRPRCVDFER